MRFRHLMSVLLLSTGWVWADQGDLNKGDFAWGMDLRTTDSKALYQMPLPVAVYQGVTQRDLSDLWIFNSAGSRVPHDLKLPPLHEKAEQEDRLVKLFPLYGTRDADPQFISLQLTERSGTGDITLSTRQVHRNKSEVIRGYLIELWEANEGHPPVVGLALDWEAGAKDFVHRFKVEQSNDLTHWSLLNSNAVIADLRFGGERLHQQNIPLAKSSARYLRLTPVDQGESVTLVSASVQIIGKKSETTPQRTVIRSVVKGEQQGEYLFELPGILPATRLEILPGERNTFVRVRLQSRAEAKDHWRQRAAGLIYDLEAEGERLQRTTLPLRRTGDRYWRLLVDDSGGGFGATMPRIEVNWIPHQLLFSARGSGPFVLAYGSARVKSNGTAGLWQGFSTEQQANLISARVSAGAPYTLAGEKALSPRMVGDWKQWLLWGVLILASLILGWMAWSTARQIVRQRQD